MVTQDIGINAGYIVRLLDRRGKLSLRQIVEITHYHESLIHSALGWLSKEDKISIFSSDDGSVYVELKNTLSDIYY